MGVNGLEGEAMQQALAQDAVDRAMHPQHVVKAQEEAIRKVLTENQAEALKQQLEAEARALEQHKKDLERHLKERKQAHRLGIASQLLAAQPLGSDPARDVEEMRRILAKTDALLKAVEE